MSSPSTRVVSSIRLTEGEAAIAPKLAGVRNVNSLTKSNPANPGLLVLPVILMSINDVGILFHASNDAWNADRASASESTGGPSGLGIGSRVVFILYLTGMQRESHLIPMTRARTCPGMGDGVRPVISTVSSGPPAGTVIVLARMRQRLR